MDGSSVAIQDSWKQRRTAFGSVASGTGSLLNTWSLNSISHKLPITGKGDQGGPFFLTKNEHHISPSYVNEPNNGSRPFYQGLMWPTSILYVSEGYGMAAHPTDQQIDANGTTAIARVEPTNPTFSLSTAIGELRNDGLPSIVGLQTLRDRSNLARKAGGEYLNVEFGWKPLVSDLRNLAKAVKESHETIHNYRAGSDKKIRRRYEYDTNEFTRFYKSGSGGAGPMYFHGFGSVTDSRFTGTGFLHENYRQRRWFSGAFRYHVPVSDDMLGKMEGWYSNSRKLLGIELTPEVVWNLSPWTWAVDWFTNTGDVLHNISAMGRDGLVMQYGYSMAETIKQSTYQGSWSCYDGAHAASYTKYTKTASRRIATPYGFGFNMSTLTNRQTAILAALGLSRVGR